MKYYDEYISLGGNCEIGFQFRRYGKEPSSLFSWLVSDIDKIIEVGNNDFHNFYDFEDLIPYTHNMVKSKKHGLCFHSKLVSKKSVNSKKLEFTDDLETRKKYHADEESKYKYLIKKWNNLVTSKLKVVYFIKDQNYKYEKILELESHIKKRYPKHKFRLIFIKEGTEFKHKVASKSLSICQVRSFSDIHYSWASDLDLWDKIFELYPLKDKVKLIGLGGNRSFLIKSINNINQNQVYSFPLNFNIAQFFEKTEFLEDAKYFLEQAKKQSSEEFVEEAYVRITKKINIENKQIKNHIKKLYTLQSEEKIKQHIIANKLMVWKYDNTPLRIDIFKEVRYVRLSLQEKNWFHLDAIEVWNINDEQVALNKSLMMSSTYKSLKPVLNKKALNGTINGGASFHTNNENRPWVVLDLEAYEKVKSIVIFNREGEYAQRALSILVETSSDLKEWDTGYDNYELFKNIDYKLLTKKQQDILENIKI